MLCKLRRRTFSPAFKLAAVKAYQEGMGPTEIFLQAGFDLDVLHADNT